MVEHFAADSAVKSLGEIVAVGLFAVAAVAAEHLVHIGTNME